MQYVCTYMDLNMNLLIWLADILKRKREPAYLVHA